MKFTDFPLDGGLQEGLAEAGYITCMPVQEQVLQNGLEGADLYVQSQTGTGKTAAYLVTILQRLVSDPALSGKKALIMVPTRELAVQVEEEARMLGACMKLKSASFYGGVGYGHQLDLLKKGVDVLIGTPGRVIDLQEQGAMDLSNVAFLVIDEADRMFDMGFYPDLRTLIKVLPKAEDRQTMLFSATLNNWVKNLAWEYTIEAKEITIEAENVTVDMIDQMLFHVSSDEKMKLLLGLIEREKPESLIVFCNTKRMSEVVSKRLKMNGMESEFIIGDLPQSKRLQVIDSFKSGSLRCLVATDVAARGIDVDDLAMVINYDLPNEAENYVHRIGRTARAGKTGKAYSFCSEQDVYNLPAIEKYCEMKIPSGVPGEEDFAADKSAGKYIRTDRYDSDYDDDDYGRDRRGGRGRPSGRGGPGGRSGAPRSGGSRSGGSRSGAPRSGGSREGARAADGRSGGPRDGRPRGPGDRNDNRGMRFPEGERRDTRAEMPRGDRDPRDERSQAERDLAKLSFEERMAYYKNKYGAEGAAPEGTASSEAGKKPARQGQRGNGGKGKGERGKPRNAGSGAPRDGARRDGAQQGGMPGQGRGGDAGRRGQGAAAAGRPQRPQGGGQQKAAATAKTAQGGNPAPGGKGAKAGGIAGFFKKVFGGGK